MAVVRCARKHEKIGCFSMVTAVLPPLSLVIDHPAAICVYREARTSRLWPSQMATSRHNSDYCDESEISSPEWHQDILEERKTKIKNSQAEFISLEELGPTVNN